MQQPNVHAVNPNPGDQVLAQLGQALQNGNPSDDEVRQNRINIMKQQMAETNMPFDVTTGLPMPSANEQATDPNQLQPPQHIQHQQSPPQVVPNQQQQMPSVQPQVTAPNPQQVTAQQPNPQLPNQPQQFQPQQQNPNPQQPNPQQQLQPNPNQFQQGDPQQPTDPNAPQLSPDEQQIVNRLEELMQEPQSQQTDPMQAAILQNQQALMAQMNGQLPNAMQDTNFVPPPPPAAMHLPQQHQQFTPALPPVVAPPAIPVQPDPFAWQDPNLNFNPAMPPQQTDPNQMLLMSGVQALTNEVRQMQQTNNQFLLNQKRESDIQSLMDANGIGRVHAERAMDYFNKGNYQAGSEVVNLAAAPVIAKKHATHERDLRRDAAGQPLTPAQPSGIRLTPNELQVKNNELANIMRLPQSEYRRMAVIHFVQQNPEFAAYAQQPESLQTFATI